MYDTETKKISRLTAILTLLHTKRILTARELASKFSVSTRTIQRDIKTLEQSGIPIITEEGKGYTLMEYFRLPPVSFTEEEANALITAEQIVLKNKDASFVKSFSEAITKIKSVLKHEIRDKANLLSERTYFTDNKTDILEEKTSNHLSTIQFAITNFCQTEIIYTDEVAKNTERVIEPFALLSTHDKWLLIAWCRLRNTFRFFRLDRIKKIALLSEKFEPHKLTLQEYFEKYH